MECQNLLEEMRKIHKTPRISSTEAEIHIRDLMIGNSTNQYITVFCTTVSVDMIDKHRTVLIIKITNLLIQRTKNHTRVSVLKFTSRNISFTVSSGPLI